MLYYYLRRLSALYRSQSTELTEALSDADAQRCIDAALASDADEEDWDGLAHATNKLQDMMRNAC